MSSLPFKKIVIYKSAILALLSFSLAFLPTVSLALAAKSPEVIKIGDIEEVIYGEEFADKSLGERLSRLEVKLFGRTGSGTTSERLEKIESQLKYGTDLAPNVELAPPIAPMLDLSQSNRAEASPTDQVRQADYAVDARSALDEATQLYSEGRTQEAQNAFQKILIRDPDNVDALYNLGVIAEEKGNVDIALINYRKALSLNPSDNEIKQAVIALENKRTSQAIKPSVSSSSSAKPVALAAPVGGSSSSSSSSLSSTAKMKSLVAEASLDYKAGRYDLAIAKLNNVALNAPQDGDVQFALAQAYRAKGDLDSARARMSKAVALNSANTLFSSSLQDIDRSIASQKTKNNDYFAGTSSPTATAGSAATGQLTPFAGSKANNLSDSGEAKQGYAWSSAAKSSRLKRAVTYGLAGAASGALSGALFGGSTNRSSRMTRNAMTGAAAGALYGLLFGR
jgi:tetratricopeptide (TPR) repeat protein